MDNLTVEPKKRKKRELPSIERTVSAILEMGEFEAILDLEARLGASTSKIVRALIGIGLEDFEKRRKKKGLDSAVLSFLGRL